MDTQRTQPPPNQVDNILRSIPRQVFNPTTMHNYLATSNVELLLVLEVWPHWFSDRAQPDVGGSKEHPVEWARHFQECMTDAGYPECQAITDGSHFVDAAAVVSQPIMKQLIIRDLADADLSSITQLNSLSPSELKEYVDPLYGGLALLHEGKVLLQPECCGSLSDVGSWVQALRDTPESGEIWVGHPTLSVSFLGSSVTLTEGSELRVAPDYLSRVTLEATLFSKLVFMAEQGQMEFEEQLVAVLVEMGLLPSLARPAAALWSGRQTH